MILAQLPDEYDLPLFPAFGWFPIAVAIAIAGSASLRAWRKAPAGRSILLDRRLGSELLLALALVVTALGLLLSRGVVMYVGLATGLVAILIALSVWRT